MSVYLSSVGMTRFGHRLESLPELMKEAASKAIGDIPAQEHTVDALYVAAMNPGELTGHDNLAALIADYLGLNPAPAFRIENAPASGSAALHQAFVAVSSGIYSKVLVIAGEKMTGLNRKELASIIAKLAPRRQRHLGITIPAMTALLTRRYMHKYDLSREDLALVAVKSHHNGSVNPLAHFHNEITVADVLSSPIISDPLRLYDCAPISDGACAVVVTSKKSTVEILGLGHGADTLYYQHRDSFTSFPATTRAAEKAYAMANVLPSDVDVVETHDAFTILELINSEDLGFFERGKSIDALKKGVTGTGGDIPINPSGGLKAKGHPVGATGLAQVCELFWQLSGDAGKRQLDCAKIGLAHNIGGFGNNALVTILGKPD